LLAHGRWFSQGTPASSTAKTGRHKIAEILLKVTLNTQKKKLKKIGEWDHNPLLLIIGSPAAMHK
jgi:hypothetical protein